MTIDELHKLWDSKSEPPRRRHEDHEHKLQVECVRWFRIQYPQHLIYAIPNGGQRNAIVAAKLKAEGVLAGIPDLHIPVARNGYHGLYIEMKNGKEGRVSQYQKETMSILEREGFKCIVCRDLYSFVNEVKHYIG